MREPHISTDIFLMSSSVEDWLSEQLHDVLGFSDRSIVQFLLSSLSLGSASEVSRQLVDLGAPPGPRTDALASELLLRLGATFPPQRHEERQTLEERHEERQTLERRRVEKERRGKRRRVAGWDEEEEVTVRQSMEKEKEEEEDARERDALSERLAAKDKVTVVERKREELEELMGRMPRLREVSRQEYLRMRQDQQIRLLEREIRDEESLFAQRKDVRMTKQEIRDLEAKKRVLALAKELAGSVEIDRLEEETKGYQMPDVKEKAATDPEIAMRNLEAQKRKKAFAGDVTDAELWERSQILNAASRFGGGAENKTSEKREQEKYPLLFSDYIDFDREELIEGEESPNENFTDSEGGAIEKEPGNELSLDQVRKSLPIYQHRSMLLAAIQENPVLIVVGETGSGKTTQLPQYLLEEGYSKDGSMKIGCTQPRRVAAMSVASRVAKEIGCKVGHQVGYSIRFEDCTSEKTVIKYMTDGMLLREFLNEPDLASYSVMIVDEAHERSLHTDILLGLLKDVSKFREDLRVIIASATVNAQKFSEYFDDAPIYTVPGRRFDVDVYYTKAPEANYLDAAVVTIFQIHFSQGAGDILVFFSGQEEIETCAEILQARLRGLGSRAAELVICPIYANLPSDLQAKIFEPAPIGCRKVVLATNIAETSLTIDGIRFVIDPGFCKQKSYNPRSGLESLVVTPISKASAEQRAGRAGRTAPGKCFRLYTQHAYRNELDDEMTPEIQRTNLGNVVLLLKSLGINDLIHFDFLDPPPAEMLMRALEQLYALGALNDLGQLTKLGRMMAEFPIDPMISKMVIQSEKYGVSEEVLTIASMLGIHGSLFYRPKDKAVQADNAHKNFHSLQGDHLTLLNVYNQWVETDYSVEWCYENFVQIRSLKRARDVREQLESLLERVEVRLLSNPNDHVSIRKAIASGFFFNTARLDKGGNYKTIKHNHSVNIHPSSSMRDLHPRWVSYNELVLTTKEFMRCVVEIRPEWLLDIAPHYYKSKELEDVAAKKMPRTRKT